jgi:transposase-like protein
MYLKPTVCPNCGVTGDFHVKSGYSKTKHNHQPNPNYKCKECDYVFTSKTHRTNKFHKKPEINAEVFKWVCSGVSLAQIARNLKIDKKTIERKIVWLANQAKIAHQTRLYDPNSACNRVSHIQLDEMETFEASRLKPLSITIAIDADSGFIFALDVAVMNCHGKLVPKSREKYGLRKDSRRQSLVKVLNTIKNCIDSSDSYPLAKSQILDQRPDSSESPESCGIPAETLRKVAENKRKSAGNSSVTPNRSVITFSCDSKKTYVPLIKKIFPESEIHQYLLSKSKRGDPKKHDPLFTINHLCARMRADVAPLARKSWTTTKNVKGLQKLLWIYLAWMNGYEIANNTNTVVSS